MKKSASSVLLLVLAFTAACATAPKQEIAEVFYPDPPAPPRLQFLTSFTGENDVVGKKSAFEAFVTGIKESSRRLDKPYGVAIWDGKIYVSDLNQGIMIFDLAKGSYSSLQGAQGMGKLLQPVNIRIDADGNKYVSDPIRGQVIIFDRNDFYVNAFGDPATWKPVDAVPRGDELYVSDMKNARVTVVERKSGAVLRQIGNEGEPSQQLSRPTNLAFDTENHLFVSDAGRFQVVKYDRDGHYLGAVGDLGTESGTFARPKGIAIDRQDRLFAIDAAFSNVQIFNKEGYLLLFFGAAGRAPGDLNLPSQIAVDYDHIKYFKTYANKNFEIESLVIVANQFGSRMINVYGFGKESGRRYQTDAELLEELKKRVEKTGKEQPSGQTREPGTEKQ